MKSKILFSALAILLLITLPACAAELTPTPENPYLEEELAEIAIATTRAEKTQTASRVLPYAELSTGELTYLAFWFTWNDETVFLPIAVSRLNDEISLPFCQLDSGTNLAIGQLFSGFEIIDGECVPDEQAPENAIPIIKVPGYFNDGLETEELNIIDLNGEYAQNLADVVTFIIKNDLLGSGDLVISLNRTEGPDGEPPGDAVVVPTYTLPVEALQMTFSSEQLDNFEGADDVVYAIERAFTWIIPAGYSDLDLLPGDKNWFVLVIDEKNRELEKAYFQIKGVGTGMNP